MNDKDGFMVINPIIEPTEDKVYRGINTALSVIPTASNIFQAIFTNPIQKRTDIWMGEMQSRLVKLEELGKLDYAELGARPEFSALFLKILQEVEITSQAEKLNSLSNFVVNLALGVDIEEDELYVLADMLKSLTPTHLKALHLYAMPCDFEDRFRELKEFSKDELGAYDASFNHCASSELAAIFYKDSSANVISQHNNTNIYQNDISYWGLVCVQLESMHLIRKLDGDKQEPPEPFDDINEHVLTWDNNKENDYTIHLKRKSTDIGFKILKLILDSTHT